MILNQVRAFSEDELNVDISVIKRKESIVEKGQKNMNFVYLNLQSRTSRQHCSGKSE